MSFCVYVMLSVSDQNKTIISNRAPWENYKYDAMKIGIQLLLIFDSWKMGGYAESAIVYCVWEIG